MGITATGGTITQVGNEKVHKFTSSGTFGVTGSGTVKVLVVGGGGGGGTHAGGGGGGGGVIYNASYAVSTGNYTVTIGGGGAGEMWSPNTAGSNGSSSVFDTLTAIGGGLAGGSDGATGSAGGCGGGGGTSGGVPGSGGSGSQGFNGGSGASGSVLGTGGGGGGGAANGSNAGTDTGGNGGAGYASTILDDSTRYYAGGGGGCGYTSGAGSGGSGGGGNGGIFNTEPSSALDGTANTGGGGGGAYGSSNLIGPGNAGSGGSGIVIVRYVLDPIILPSTQTLSETLNAPTQAFINNPTVLPTALSGTLGTNDPVARVDEWNPVITIDVTATLNAPNPVGGGTTPISEATLTVESPTLIVSITPTAQSLSTSVIAPASVVIFNDVPKDAVLSINSPITIGTANVFVSTQAISSTILPVVISRLYESGTLSLASTLETSVPLINPYVFYSVDIALTLNAPLCVVTKIPDTVEGTISVLDEAPSVSVIPTTQELSATRLASIPGDIMEPATFPLSFTVNSPSFIISSTEDAASVSATLTLNTPATAVIHNQLSLLLTVDPIRTIVIGVEIDYMDSYISDLYAQNYYRSSDPVNLHVHSESIVVFQGAYSLHLEASTSSVGNDVTHWFRRRPY